MLSISTQCANYACSFAWIEDMRQQILWALYSRKLSLSELIEQRSFFSYNVILNIKVNLELPIKAELELRQ